MPPIERGEGEVKRAGKKVLALFKGAEVSVADLLKTLPVPVQFETGVIKEYQAQYSRVYEQRIGRLLIAVGSEVAFQGTNVVQLVCYSPSQRKMTRVTLPLDFKVRALTGRQGQAMSERLLAATKENFALTWARPIITMGADPEIFVVDKGGMVIPAFKFLPPKKLAHTTYVNGSKDYVQTYWDGFQAEYTVPARACLVELASGMRGGLKALYHSAQHHSKGACLDIHPVVQIPDEVLASEASEHVEFGCAPSLNAYGLSTGGPGLDGRSTPFRFAGGHIHFGVQLTEAAYVNAVKAMDAILAVACVPLFQSYDSPVRRRYYGLPGEYRRPAHGLEYRVLSNVWLSHPLLYNLVFELARLAFGVGISGLLPAWDATEEETISVVRESSVDGARAILTRNRAKLVKLLAKVPAFVGYEDRIFRIFTEDLRAIIAKPEDVVGNWRLNVGDYDPWQGPGTNWGYSKNTIMDGGKV